MIIVHFFWIFSDFDIYLDDFDFFFITFGSNCFLMLSTFLCHLEKEKKKFKSIFEFHCETHKSRNKDMLDHEKIITQFQFINGQIMMFFIFVFFSLWFSTSFFIYFPYRAYKYIHSRWGLNSQVEQINLVKKRNFHPQNSHWCNNFCFFFRFLEQCAIYAPIRTLWSFPWKNPSINYLYQSHVVNSTFFEKRKKNKKLFKNKQEPIEYDIADYHMSHS